MKVNITVTELGKAREVNPYSYYSSHYEPFEQQVQTHVALDQDRKPLPCGWTGLADKERSRHTRDIFYIAHIPEEKQPPVVENEAVGQLAERKTAEEILSNGNQFSDSFERYYKIGVLDAMEAYAKQEVTAATLASGMVKVDEVINVIGKWLVAGRMPNTEILFEQIRSLTNSK